MCNRLRRDFIDSVSDRNILGDRLRLADRCDCLRLELRDDLR